MDDNKEAMESARQKAKELADRIKGLHLAAKEAVQGFKDFNFEVRDTRSLAQKVSDAFVKMDMDMRNANMSADDLLKNFQEFTKTLQNDFSVALDNARQKLDDARQRFDEFRNVISGSIKGIIRFEKAVEEGDFLAGLIKQADDATKFSDQVKKLIEMGLSESAITRVVDAGYEAGTIIADQIIAGGQTVVNQVNKLVADVELVADAVGYFGAQRFYQAGVDQANALVNGILEQMNARQSELESMIARISNLLDTKARAEAALATTTSTGGGGGAKTNLVADAVKSPTGPKNPLDTVVKGTSLTWNEIN
jgi:polyhydroxyalkanoate synthesis regulator phasin